MTIKRLLVNGMVSPVGIGCDAPVFSFDTDTEDAIFGVDVWENDSKRTVAECTVSTSMGKQFRILKRLEAGKCYGWSVTDGTHRVCSQFETGMIPNTPFIGAQGATRTLPLFTRSFFAKADCQKARLYLTCVGLYRAFINGERVGRQYLTGNDGEPSRLFTQTYDVTDLIWYGVENELKVVLCGEGACFSARLLMTDSEGKQQSVCTDSVWRVSESGGMYDRQSVYETWNCNACGSEAVVSVKSIPLSMLIFSGDRPPLIVRRIYFPIRVTDFWEEAREWHFDFGRTVNGIFRIQGRLSRGIRLDVICSETKDFSSPCCVFSFVSDGLEQTWEPIFSCLRFRYVCVAVSGEKAYVTVAALELKRTDAK